MQPAIKLHIPERARLTEILCRQADDLNGDRLQDLYIEAATLMTALYGK